MTVKHNLRIGGKMKNNIVVLRKQNKIKQQQLAAAVGVSRQSIYSIEKCKFLPTVDTAIKIARFFGKPIEEIFFLDDKWIISETREDDDRELVTGQGLEKYAALKYGRFPFAFCGGEVAAVFNAMRIYGEDVGLESTVEEFENNKMPVMFGLAGTDVKRLGEYFDGHGIAYEKTCDKNAFCEKLTPGKIFVAAYYECAKRPIHTVAGFVEKERIKIYNIRNSDAAPTCSVTDEFFGKRSLICGYVLE